MKFNEAIMILAKGTTIFSNTNRMYTYEELQPKWYGKHYASFNDVGMTKAELTGEWKLDE